VFGQVALIDVDDMGGLIVGQNCLENLLINSNRLRGEFLSGALVYQYLNDVQSALLFQLRKRTLQQAILLLAVVPVGISSQTMDVTGHQNPHVYEHLSFCYAFPWPWSL